VSGYERIEKFQNIAVGIFVIVGVIALGWLIFKFNDLPITMSKINSYEVAVQFASAPGVQKDTPIRFCGYQIGRVTDVKPPEIRDELKDGQKTGRRFHQSLVILNIDKQYKNIPSNVKVKLMTRGLGSSYIELVYEPNKPLMPLDANRPEESKYLADGILLQGQVGTSSEFFPEESQKKLDELIGSLITMMNNTNEIIGDPNNRQNVKTSLANLSQATAEATKTLKQLEVFLASANQTSEELSKMVAAAGLILDKVNSGQGTAGRIVNDARFYESLLENSRQLKTLLDDMQQLVKNMKEKGVKVSL
jgi:phospholipid/cholesterol/gamma-HCH transport system substrate-binding protein